MHVHRSKDDSPFAPFGLSGSDEPLNASIRRHGALDLDKAKPQFGAGLFMSANKPKKLQIGGETSNGH
jgi:hypothetical protein